MILELYKQAAKMVTAVWACVSQAKQEQVQKQGVLISS